jgi:hypothetical protein
MRAKDATLNVVSVSENSPIHEVVRLAPVEIRVSAVQSSTDHDLFVASLFGHIAATLPAVSDLCEGIGIQPSLRRRRDVRRLFTRRPSKLQLNRRQRSSVRITGQEAGSWPPCALSDGEA